MKPRTREASATPGALAALGMEPTPPDEQNVGKGDGDPLLLAPHSVCRVICQIGSSTWIQYVEPDRRLGSHSQIL
jgi:hypothetical protein